MQVKGEYLTIGKEEYYKISQYDLMKPFFISLASNCDIWMFVSSNGGLTAGRKTAELALFPYETEDKILASTDTGPKTLVRIKKDGALQTWEPFSTALLNNYRTERNLYKNIAGNSLIFEETNMVLGLCFRYQWNLSEKFGLVRTSTIINQFDSEAEVEVLDGLINILPYGIPHLIQESKSCLADAYKAAELDDKTGAAYYYLTTRIDDRPEPSEMLKTTFVWNDRSSGHHVLLSSDQLKSFASGAAVNTENYSFGRRGAYLLSFRMNLAGGGRDKWKIIADVGLGQPETAALRKKLLAAKDRKDKLSEEVDADIARCTAELEQIVAAADGLQVTNDRKASVHHQMNVLYNNMRGGAFLDNYDFHFDEFLGFIKKRNAAVYAEKKEFFEQFRENHSIPLLKEKAFQSGDPDLIRLCMEFLPLSFSRRHGDPSRPWNRFSIGSKDATGRRTYNYQGNWRDIFQNWEAMSLSFPEYLDNIIVKFLNATTIDGFNPYRIHQDGIDWETMDPHDPWSNIGYWGDHQIIYLLKLLECLSQHSVENLDRLFRHEIFCFADLPYEIKNYDEMVKNGKRTILFNADKHKRTEAKEKTSGSDARLLYKGKKIYHVHLIEKLVIPILSKLSNLVVDGGIWMNTQKPEWNDANNAIVGNGLSMVTTYYLRRHLTFLLGILAKYENEKFPLSKEAAEWASSVRNVLEQNSARVKTGNINNAFRKELLDSLGRTFSDYRGKVYRKGFTGRKETPVRSIIDLMNVSLLYIDRTIEKNLDGGNLYNAYNIFSFGTDGKDLTVNGLYPMLEGQTSALSSGKLTVPEILTTLKAMRSSGLFCAEQNSYYLYPVRKLPKYLEKNILPPERIKAIPLLELLIKEGCGFLVCKDADGNVRFSSDFYNVHDLAAALEKLSSDPKYTGPVKKWSDAVIELYEEIFRHKEFTGRSGVMFKYEGIGCIYWHQNSKLLLAVQDAFYNALQNGEDPKTISELKNEYYLLREGLGFNKEPADWGAFPFDPYSHTPSFMGAQQPGMTGQVKEEILTRRKELGVTVRNGSVVFLPDLLRRSEFLVSPAEFRFWNLRGKEEVLELENSTLAFTLCQVPVIYRLSDKNEIQVTDDKGTAIYSGNTLSKAVSDSVFLRNGSVSMIQVLLDGNKIV